jgi:hypothetical protein
LHAHVLNLNRDSTPFSHPMHPTSRHEWPNQPRPGKETRKLWTKHIKAMLLQDDERLRVPLGKWTLPVDQRDRLHPTLCHPTSNTIHQSNGTECCQLQVKHKDRRTIQASIESPTRSIRHPGCPVDTVSVTHDTLFA